MKSLILLLLFFSQSAFSDEYQICAEGYCWNENGGTSHGSPGSNLQNQAIQNLGRDRTDYQLQDRVNQQQAKTSYYKNQGDTIQKRVDQKRQEIESQPPLPRYHHQESEPVSMDFIEQEIANARKNPIDHLPDLPDSELPFRLKSEDRELYRLEQDLSKVNPHFDDQVRARDFGLKSVQLADHSLVAGDGDSAGAYTLIAQQMLDIAIGMTPGLNIGQSIYELAVGKDLVTGEALSLFDRGLAGANILSMGTLGVVSKVSKIAHGFGKTSKISDALNIGERLIKNAPKAAESAQLLRNSPGMATISKSLHNKQTMLRGSQANAGLVPFEIGEKLQGRRFSSFGAFRKAFWKATAESKHAIEFDERSLLLMKKGKAPLVDKSQFFEGKTKYELHHMHPINQGGSVYDLSNIMVITPKLHNQILDKGYHYGRN